MALEENMQLISNYITEQHDSGKETNVFKSYEKIKNEIILPIIKNILNKDKSPLKQNNERTVTGASPQSFTMSLTEQNDNYNEQYNKTDLKKPKARDRSLSNILNAQNTNSLNLSVTKSEKEHDRKSTNPNVRAFRPQNSYNQKKDSMV